MRFTSKTFRKRAKLTRKRLRKNRKNPKNRITRKRATRMQKQKQRGGSDLPKSLFFHEDSVVADPLQYDDTKYGDVENA